MVAAEPLSERVVPNEPQTDGGHGRAKDASGRSLYDHRNRDRDEVGPQRNDHQRESNRSRSRSDQRSPSLGDVDEFAARHLTADQCKPRKVLYEDPELGFCVCGHVYEKPAHGQPHDHGPSWAIYGLAVGDTEMTDWKVVRKGDGTNPTLVEPEKVYVLKPGDAHFYDVGVVHSPKRDGLTKLVRIEGENLQFDVDPKTLRKTRTADPAMKWTSNQVD